MVRACSGQIRSISAARVRVEFRRAQAGSDGGLLVMRKVDGAPGPSGFASVALLDARRGKNRIHRLDGLFRQSVFGRLAGYEDIKDPDRLAHAPVIRQVVGWKDPRSRSRGAACRHSLSGRGPAPMPSRLLTGQPRFAEEHEGALGRTARGGPG